MSGENPLIGPIEGYTIAVFKNDTDKGDVLFYTRILEQDLKLSKVGGAHITNVEDLVIMIEDAVFQKENEK